MLHDVERTPKCIINRKYFEVTLITLTVGRRKLGKYISPIYVIDRSDTYNNQTVLVLHFCNKIIIPTFFSPLYTGYILLVLVHRMDMQ